MRDRPVDQRKRLGIEKREWKGEEQKVVLSAWIDRSKRAEGQTFDVNEDKLARATLLGRYL